MPTLMDVDEPVVIDLTLAAPLFVTYDVDKEINTYSKIIYENRIIGEDKYKVFSPEAKFIKWRRLLVDLLFDLGNQYELNIATTHVAVNFLDRVLYDRQHLSKTEARLTALTCMLIASKFEEKDDKIPLVDDMLQFLDDDYSYSCSRVVEMERALLKKLEWNLSCNTVIHCLEYYMSKGTMFDMDHIKGKAVPSKAPKYFRKYALFFSEICLQEYDFQEYSTSLLASAMIAACRRSLNIKPLWREELQILTGYSEEDIYGCYEHIWAYYMSSFPAEYERRKGEDYDASPTFIGQV